VTAQWDPKAQSLMRKVIGRMKEAEQLRAEGDKGAALASTRAALHILRDPAIDRDGPVVLTAVTNLTIRVEELASELGAPGADRRDVAEALAVLKRVAAEMAGSPESSDRARAAFGDLPATWIPRLEARLGAG
jgi:hypothetical protein